jgi:hypothetical protein
MAVGHATSRPSSVVSRTNSKRTGLTRKDGINHSHDARTQESLGRRNVPFRFAINELRKDKGGD